MFDIEDVMILLERAALVDVDADTLLTIGVSLPELWEVAISWLCNMDSYHQQ